MPNIYMNTKISEYQAFVKIVEDIGFMPFSKNCIDFLSLDGDTGLTYPEQCHTDLSSDPWPWRVQIEEDHKAAYAKLFNKKPGFISIEWYPKFLAARRGGRSFKEMFSDGLFSNYARQIYNLFDSYSILATHEIKALCGFTKENNSKYETAMCELQMGMFLTTNGMTRKTGASGEPYGWPATAYSTVETWAGEKLIEESSYINPQDAREDIVNRISDFSLITDPKKIKRFAGF